MVTLLTPEERFRYAIEASARGDVEEFDDYFKNGSMETIVKTYQLFAAAEMVKTALMIHSNRYLGMLDLIGHIEEKQPDFPLTDSLRIDVLNDFKSCWQAFSLFCEYTLQIDSLIFAKALTPDLLQVFKVYGSELDMIVPDKQDVILIRDEFNALWDEHQADPVHRVLLERFYDA